MSAKKRDDDTHHEEPPQATISLQESATRFRSFFNAFRSLQGMGEAVEAALTAEHHLGNARREREELDKAIGEKRAFLSEIENQTLVARGNLEDLRNAIKGATDAKKGASTEQERERALWEKTRAEAVAETDKILADLRAQEVRATQELAAAKALLAEHFAAVQAASR